MLTPFRRSDGRCACWCLEWVPKAIERERLAARAAGYAAADARPRRDSGRGQGGEKGHVQCAE